MKLITTFIILVLALFSCKKAEDRACFKGVGEDTTKEIDLQSFNDIFLGSHIDFVLVQDTVEKVILTGGSNLVNFIGTDVVDGKLTVTNNNKCNFLRTYKKSVIAEIHLVDVTQIEFDGTNPLVCKNQLTCPELSVIIKNGAGEFNLNIDNIVLKVSISNGWGNMVVSGSSKYARFSITSNGFIDAYGLNVLDSMDVVSKSPGTSKINIDNTILRSETSSSGDIWYVGIPVSIDHNQYGTGELIDKN